jgi:hypothetical protein
VLIGDNTIPDPGEESGTRVEASFFINEGIYRVMGTAISDTAADTPCFLENRTITIDSLIVSKATSLRLTLNFLES